MREKICTHHSHVYNIHHLRIYLLLSVLFFQEFEHIFPEDGPQGLPPFIGIEHKIDLSHVQVYQIDQLIGQTQLRLRR